MKLLKKLLPFATIASVATIGLTTMAACTTDPAEPEDKPMTYVWDIDSENPEVQPADWSLPQSRGEGEDYPDWVATEEYLTDASHNKKILAGDIACSYYSEEFGAYENNQYLKNVTTIIDNINPSAWTASFKVIENPIDGSAYEQYYMEYEVKDFQYVVADIQLTVSGHVYNGWAIEPLALWLADAEHIANAIKYLQIDKDWSVTIKDSPDDTQPVIYNCDSPVGTKGTSTEGTLWYFIQQEVWGLNLSFKTNYWAYNG